MNIGRTTLTALVGLALLAGAPAAFGLKTQTVANAATVSKLGDLASFRGIVVDTAALVVDRLAGTKVVPAQRLASRTSKCPGTTRKQA